MPIPFTIRSATEADWAQLWPICEAVFRAGETYPCATDISQEEAHRYWMEHPSATFVASNSSGSILGSYYIKPNQPPLGAHVCNCGYLVAESARRQGVARQLCEHSQQVAREMGFRAMQYNLVVSTNEVAVKLWTSCGFRTVGTLDGAFKHARLGFVDAYVMYKTLTS